MYKKKFLKRYGWQVGKSLRRKTDRWSTTYADQDVDSSLSSLSGLILLIYCCLKIWDSPVGQSDESLTKHLKVSHEAKQTRTYSSKAKTK